MRNALEKEGWSVWWDPKLRAGERFNDVIEKVLKESKCVVVMWSKRSVKSVYVKDEATYALNRNKLVPVMIEKVELPFRFEGLHTPRLYRNGSKAFSEFPRLLDDITIIIGPSTPKRQKKQAASMQQSIPARAPRKPESKLEPGTILREKLKIPDVVMIREGTFRMGGY